MIKSESFFARPLRGFEKTKYISNKAKKIIDKTKGYLPDWAIADLPVDELTDILENAAYISDAIRSAVRDAASYTSLTREEVIGLATPVEIEVGLSPQGHLRLTTPLLVGKSYTRSGHLGFAAKDALWSYVAKGNNIPRLEQYTVIYKRYTDALRPPLICDNDNMETKHITNAIADAMGTSDNAMCASFHYTTVPSSRRVTEITVCPRECFGDLAAYLLYPIPEGLA